MVSESFLLDCISLSDFPAADGEIDAAELDRELIASRLRQDVIEHSGKLHRFVADSVCPSLPSINAHSLTSLHISLISALLLDIYGRAGIARQLPLLL